MAVKNCLDVKFSEVFFHELGLCQLLIMLLESLRVGYLICHITFGALCAQGLSPEKSAAFGVYLHGMAGDMAAEEKGEYGMIANNIIEYIPYAIKRVIK